MQLGERNLEGGLVGWMVYVVLRPFRQLLLHRPEIWFRLTPHSPSRSDNLRIVGNSPGGTLGFAESRDMMAVRKTTPTTGVYPCRNPHGR